MISTQPPVLSGLPRWMQGYAHKRVNSRGTKATATETALSP